MSYFDIVVKVSNKKKHGVSFETAQLVFDDPKFITFVENVIDGEERWYAIGSIHQAMVVLVVLHLNYAHG